MESQLGEYDRRCHDMLCMMVAECSAAFERLPCLWDVDILRNILYAGVWVKFLKMREAKNSGNL